ncbi:MAG: AAA family ATPase [Cytophagales bacterium]|nr:AAA family ATPase [Cytophagales bacterium]
MSEDHIFPSQEEKEKKTLPKGDEEGVQAFRDCFSRLKKEIAKVVVGQEETLRFLLVSLFCRGHTLLVGVPGLAKTLLIQTLSEALDLSFSRIQFTPDLMPSDILGSETLDKDRQLRFSLGPIFSNVVLADEINRTPPKTQAALLEAMQEKQVTLGGKRHPLPLPFFVLATQNPIEQEGTYPLPEAQLDRFMMLIRLDYPSLDEEIQVIKNTTSDRHVQVQVVLSKEEISFFQDLIRRVPVTDHVLEYAVRLVHATRPGSSLRKKITEDYIQWGAGPRASQSLIMGAKCHALWEGRTSPDIEDARAVAVAVLRHRIVKNFKATAENIQEEDIIKELC